MAVIPKLAVALASAALLAGSSSVAAAQAPLHTPTPAQQEAIEVFAETGVLEGTACSPEDCTGAVRRWEVAVWTVRLLDAEPKEHRAFRDVEPDQWSAGYAQRAFDLGVTHGCRLSPLRFCPGRDTTRGQMAAFVVRAFDLDEIEPPRRFPDVPRDGVFADNISALVNAGIAVPGCDDGEDMFCPRALVPAAQAVEWLHEASQLGSDSFDTGRGESNTGGGDTGGGDTGGGDTGGGDTGGGDTGGGAPGGGNPDPPINPDGDSPGGGDGTPAPIARPSGVCSHDDPHSLGGDHKSYLVIDGAYYAHWHEGESVRWVYWPPSDPDQSAPIDLAAGPCAHP